MMSDSDPEKYTVDEMMKRLRSRSGKGGQNGEPELVTRDDGSEMVRVRKRKRRSRQPHKEAESKRRKRSLVFAVTVTVTVLALGLSILGWVLYLNSAGYRDSVVSRVEQWSGAKVNLTQFRATPVSVGAQKIEFTWPEDQAAASLVLHGITGELKLSSHLTGVWSGEQIRSANGGELVLRAALPASSDTAQRPSGACPFHFAFRTPRLTVKFGDGEQVALTVSNSEASFSMPDPAIAAGNLMLQGGRTRLGNWGMFNLDFASILLDESGVRVGNIQLSPEGVIGGEILLDGTGMSNIQTRGGASELAFGVKGMPAMHLFGAKMGGLVEGKFETPEAEVSAGRCMMDVSDLSSLQVEALVQSSLSSSVTLHNLAFLNVLADVLNSSRYRLPRLESEAPVLFKRNAQMVSLEDLSLVADGVMKVTGKLQVGPGDRLSGRLEVGLPKSVVGTVDSFRIPAVFTREEGAYFWASVELSGAASKPSDDLAKQLESATRDDLPVSVGGNSFEDEFLKLTSPEEGR